jgi:hypothetical protein
MAGCWPDLRSPPLPQAATSERFAGSLEPGVRPTPGSLFWKPGTRFVVAPRCAHQPVAACTPPAAWVTARNWRADLNPREASHARRPGGNHPRLKKLRGYISADACRALLRLAAPITPGRHLARLDSAERPQPVHAARPSHFPEMEPARALPSRGACESRRFAAPARTRRTPDRSHGLRAGGDHSQAPGPGGGPLPGSTDFELDAFRENARFTGRNPRTRSRDAMDPRGFTPTTRAQSNGRIGGSTRSCNRSEVTKNA